MDDKIRNVLPDLPDLRDRSYNPTLRLLLAYLERGGLMRTSLERTE